MPNAICIFEDELYSQLYPLTLTRPVFDLRCGILTLKDKIRLRFPESPLYLLCRIYLQEIVQEEFSKARVNELPAGPALFFNAKVLVGDDFISGIDFKEECIYEQDGIVVAAFLHERAAKRVGLNKHNIVSFEGLPGVKRSSIKTALISFPWDLVNSNSREHKNDFALFAEEQSPKSLPTRAILLNEEHIRIGTNAVLKPGVVLDAEKGPITIGENVTIMSNAVIQGPASVGYNSLIKIGAKIYGGTSIGEFCKIGGEVEGSIIHSYSNKQHDGFLGHSYIGQWVNLGADTNNSDLKNNYGPVRVFIDGDWVDSGSQFVGLFMGDHSKSGINTMFNTGTVTGIASNIYGAGFPAKNIPSFSWGGGAGLVEHDLEKAIETARTVMARRGIQMSRAYERMFRHVFEMTKGDRQNASG